MMMRDILGKDVRLMGVEICGVGCVFVCKSGWEAGECGLWRCGGMGFGRVVCGLLFLKRRWKGSFAVEIVSVTVGVEFWPVEVSVVA